VRTGGAHQAQKLRRGFRAVIQQAVGERLEFGIHYIGEPALHAAHQRGEGERALVAVATDENLVTEVRAEQAHGFDPDLHDGVARDVGRR
jgi:hypothetical protein